VRVVVIGAGPAGAAVSLLLSRAGVDVTLVEKETSFERVFRGEGLMPLGLDALAEMQLSWSVTDVPGRLVESWRILIDGEEVLTVPEPVEELGSRAFRVASPGAILRNFVGEATAYPSFSFRPGTRFVDVVRGTDGRVTGTTVTNGRGRFDLAADLVLGCDGRASAVRGKAGLELELEKQQYDIAWFKVDAPPRMADACDFRGTLGMGVIVCRPADPEAKGRVERANRYLETSFLPGRSFAGVEDFNAQLTDWLTRANRRTHRGLQCRPADRIAEDRSAMLQFPPVLPDVALRFGTRLGRDHCVRVATNDYSVHPRVIGRRVEVRAELDWVVVTCDGTEVARHRRSLAKHRTIVDPAHGRARRAMRERAMASPDVADVEERDLTDYDRVLGVA
jgi:2-polyprenyl-6-methoxyphenol hydroxylase-like FAD-dependent oxidoreductase